MNQDHLYHLCRYIALGNVASDLMSVSLTGKRREGICAFLCMWQMSCASSGCRTYSCRSGYCQSAWTEGIAVDKHIHLSTNICFLKYMSTIFFPTCCWLSLYDIIILSILVRGNLLNIYLIVQTFGNG